MLPRTAIRGITKQERQGAGISPLGGHVETGAQLAKLPGPVICRPDSIPANELGQALR